MSFSLLHDENSKFSMLQPHNTVSLFDLSFVAFFFSFEHTLLRGVFKFVCHHKNVWFKMNFAAEKRKKHKRTKRTVKFFHWISFGWVPNWDLFDANYTECELVDANQFLCELLLVFFVCFFPKKVIIMSQIEIIEKNVTF